MGKSMENGDSAGKPVFQPEEPNNCLTPPVEQGSPKKPTSPYNSVGFSRFTNNSGHFSKSAQFKEIRNLKPPAETSGVSLPNSDSESDHKGSFFSPKEVAKALGVSESSVKRWCDAGKIANIKTAGGHRRILLGNVVEFVRRKKKKLVAPQHIGLYVTNLPTEISELQQLLVQRAAAGDEPFCRSLVLQLYINFWSLEKIFDQVILPALDPYGQGGIDDLPLKENSYDSYCAATATLKVVLENLRPLLPNPVNRNLTAIGAFLGDEVSEIMTLGIEMVLREMGWGLPNQVVPSSPEGLVLAAISHNPVLFYTCLSPCPEGEVEAAKVTDTMNRIARELTAGVPVLITKDALPSSISDGLESVSTSCSLTNFASIIKKLFVI